MWLEEGVCMWWEDGCENVLGRWGVYVAGRGDIYKRCEYGGVHVAGRGDIYKRCECGGVYVAGRGVHVRWEEGYTCGGKSGVYAGGKRGVYVGGKMV